MKRHASSQDHDSGTARLRSRNRGVNRPAGPAPVVLKRVVKTYRGRLPVSGVEPPRLTKAERARLEGRAA